MILKEHVTHLRRIVSRDQRYIPFLEIPTIKAHEHQTAKVYSRCIRFDHFNLSPEVEGIRFNPSIIASGDGYILSYRTGWAGSNIYAVRLNKQFAPVSKSYLLKLRHRASRFGREDSRWFRLNGKLHIMFIGVEGGQGPTNVLFARINEETFAVEDRFHPKIPGRQEWEKNHAYYDVDGIAHAVYTIAPHRILKIEGRRAEFVAETPTKVRWTGGRICGGASPVLHNGEWYHFFHGSTTWNGRRLYNMGCYTFENKHPWRITRFSPEPLDVADPTIPHDANCDVLFPGGAVYENGEWIIAHGIHDRWCEIRTYDADWVESQLEGVK